MSNALGQSVWFRSATSVYSEVVALLCSQHVAVTLTFLDGSDHVAMLHEVDDGELWYRPPIGDEVEPDQYEGVPMEHVMAIRVL
jgi:hypothetical protein